MLFLIKLIVDSPIECSAIVECSVSSTFLPVQSLSITASPFSIHTSPPFFTQISEVRCLGPEQLKPMEVSWRLSSIDIPSITKHCHQRFANCQFHTSPLFAMGRLEWDFFKFNASVLKTCVCLQIDFSICVGFCYNLGLPVTES